MEDSTDLQNKFKWCFRSHLTIITDITLVAILEINHGIKSSKILVDHSLPIDEIVAVYNDSDELRIIVQRYYSNELHEEVMVSELTKKIYELEHEMRYM